MYSGVVPSVAALLALWGRPAVILVRFLIRNSASSAIADVNVLNVLWRPLAESDRLNHRRSRWNAMHGDFASLFRFRPIFLN